MIELLIALIGGLVGGVISPILLQEYRDRKRERVWAAPRKKHLERMLREKEWRSLNRLCLETGMDRDACRSLLMDIGARGGSIEVKGSHIEGWTLTDFEKNETKQ